MGELSNQIQQLKNQLVSLSTLTSDSNVTLKTLSFRFLGASIVEYVIPAQVSKLALLNHTHKMCQDHLDKPSLSEEVVGFINSPNNKAYRLNDVADVDRKVRLIACLPDPSPGVFKDGFWRLRDEDRQFVGERARLLETHGFYPSCPYELTIAHALGLLFNGESLFFDRIIKSDARPIFFDSSGVAECRFESDGRRISGPHCSGISVTFGEKSTLSQAKKLFEMSEPYVRE